LGEEEQGSGISRVTQQELEALDCQGIQSGVIDKINIIFFMAT
jgi:hypothetical protein